MPSLKRKSNYEEDFSCHMNRVTRKNKKTRLSQNGFTENVNTQGEDVTLPVYKSDEANDSELITQKFHQIKLVKDNRNAEISRAPYDSNGSVWNILEKADVTKSCTDEDILGMKKVHKNRKSKTNRGRVDEEVKVTSLISVQSLEVNDVKEVISSNRNDNNENKAQPKVKKKHKLKNKFNQSEMCCTIEDDMPLVFDREKVEKNEVQNIENTVESEQNGGITNQMQVEEERQRQVELERGKTSRNVKKNKKKKTLPNTENKDVSDEYEKNDVINEVCVVKKENLRMVNEEFDVTEAETENGNVREQKRSKRKKRKSKRNSTENCDVREKNDMISEVSVVKEQNVRMMNEEFDVREAEAQNGNVTEQMRSKKKKRKSKRNSCEHSDEYENNNIIKEVSIVKEQNVRIVNEEFDVREAEAQNGNVTEQKRSKKKKRKSKRNSTENSNEWEKNMINEVSIVKEQNVRTVNEEFDKMAAETQNENVTEQKRSKKKKRKSKRNSTKNSNEWEKNMINEVSIVKEQNVRTVNEEFDLREVPTDNGNVLEEKSKKKKRNSTVNSDECEKNDMINEVSIVNEQNVRVVSEECYVKEAKGEMGNVTEQTNSEKKKRKSKRHSTENREECEKNDVINEVNFVKMQKARIENREFEVMEAKTGTDNVTEQKRIKKKKRKSKMLSTENSDECEKNNVINEVSIIKEQNVRMVSNVKEAEGGNGNVTEQKKKEKKKLKSKRHSTENSNEAGNVMMEYTKVIDKENEEIIAEDKIRKKKLGKVENVRERMITKLSNERKSELENVEWKQVSKENFVSSRKKLLEELVEDKVQIIHVEEMFQGNERVVENRGGKVERERKKKLKRLKSRAKQNTNMENVSYDPLSREVADTDGNNIEQNNENETIGRIKKKVTKLSIDSEEEEFENVDGKASGELVINSDMNKHWCIEDDSEEEDEEDKNFIVDDNYVSYDENATSDEEYEDTECSSGDDSGSEDNEDCTEEEEKEEEEEEEKLQCLSARQRKKKMALQFFDMEAEEGEETDIEDEEEEISSEDDDSDGKDGVEGVEQFIDSEAKEEITFVRRKKKVQAIDSEEEGKKQERSPQAESLEKTMHIMKKLTRIMTVGVLKGKTIRKQKTIVSKEIEDKEHDSEVRIRMNESNDFTVRAVKENKRPDGKRVSQKREELRIQLKVGEEIREILGEDKLGKRKRRKSATDRGRGYASDSEYVEAKIPRVETNNLFQL